VGENRKSHKIRERVTTARRKKSGSLCRTPKGEGKLGGKRKKSSPFLQEERKGWVSFPAVSLIAKEEKGRAKKKGSQKVE